MAPRPKRSRINQENARKRFRVSVIDQQQPGNETGRVETGDIVLAQMDLDGDDEDDNTFLDEDSVVEEDMRIEAEEVHWDNRMISEKTDALSKLSYFSEADKKLKYSTRPGGSERSLQRWKAKFKTNVCMASLSTYNFTSDANASHENIEGHVDEPVKHSLHELVAKVESRMKGNTSKTEMNQLRILFFYYQDLLKGKKKMEASLNIARLALGNRGPYMASVIRAWGKLFEQTGSLPSPDRRGQHKKLRTALDDEDIKRNGRIEKMNISLTTVTGYLRTWGFSLGRHTKDVYFDGHERDDVVQYRQQWAKRMMAYRSQMKEYDGRDCEVVIEPVLAAGAREIVLITHDECYFNSNDDNAVTWTERGESIIKKKGQGLGLMVSDFYCACHGPLRFEQHTSRVILEPGKNRDGYWKSVTYGGTTLAFSKSYTLDALDYFVSISPLTTRHCRLMLWLLRS
ncbi:hypothetical protein V1527DRAFT_474827 [Lipomyces starkeyi]